MILNEQKPIVTEKNNGLRTTFNYGQSFNNKNTEFYDNAQTKKTFIFDRKKTNCPCGEHSNFSALTNHESGGKCWTCCKFFPPVSGKNNLNSLRQVLQNSTHNTKTTRYELEREHIYWRPDGDNYLMKVSIYRDANGKKYCPQYRWIGELVWENDGSLRAVGNWEKGIENVQTTLYNVLYLITLQKSPQVLRDNTIVYIPEGEKDCDTLKKHGLIATCNPMGAGKWRDSYNLYLKELTCIIIPDNDKIGHEHANSVFKSLEGIAKSVHIIDLVELMPDLPPKGDITDFLARGGKI